MDRENIEFDEIVQLFRTKYSLQGRRHFDCNPR